MNRTIFFDSPFLLGFEHTRSLVERAAKAAGESYPPYNVEDLGEGLIRITLAVAGFSPDQLSVTVEDNQLVISGRRDVDPKDASEASPSAQGGPVERAYLHRGIAARGFLRSFVLADGMEVSGAILEHGLLHIDVSRIPPAKLVKRIAIRSAG
jgi:HSP20 family molecular chaperone IbpA